MAKLRFIKGTPQYRVLEHAVLRYGDRLRIEPNRMTVTTLQGNTETGWIVYGRAHGGGDVGVVFASRLEAQATIDALAAAHGPDGGYAQLLDTNPNFESFVRGYIDKAEGRA